MKFWAEEDENGGVILTPLGWLILSAILYVGVRGCIWVGDSLANYKYDNQVVEPAQRTEVEAIDDLTTEIQALIKSNDKLR